MQFVTATTPALRDGNLGKEVGAAQAETIWLHVQAYPWYSAIP